MSTRSTALRAPRTCVQPTLRRNLYTGQVVVGKPFETVQFQAKVTHATVSADNKWLAVATDDGTCIFTAAILFRSCTRSLQGKNG